MSYTVSYTGYFADNEEAWNFMLEEFESIAVSLQEFEIISLTTNFKAPTKPREGDIIFADGTQWDPGNGKGVYVYYNGIWNKL